MDFEEFQAMGGNKEKMHKDAKIKSETRNYMINDGDIVEFFYHRYR